LHCADAKYTVGWLVLPRNLVKGGMRAYPLSTRSGVKLPQVTDSRQSLHTNGNINLLFLSLYPYQSSILELARYRADFLRSLKTRRDHSSGVRNRCRSETSVWIRNARPPNPPTENRKPSPRQPTYQCQLNSVHYPQSTDHALRFGTWQGEPDITLALRYPPSPISIY
jgi:hypothetical protein